MPPKARLLVIDDDPVLLRTTAELLKSAEFEVREASSAPDGLRMAREWSPDLILLDVVLQEMSGVELCHQLKNDPATSTICVALISTHQTSSPFRVDGLNFGADAYIARPIAARELIARVRALIRLEQAQAALRAAQQELERRVLERTAELSTANERLRVEMEQRSLLEARLLQTRKMEAIGRLAAGIAHDFNNILTVIRGNTSLLQLNARLPPDSRECVDEIAAAAERAAEFTRRLLLFTRRQVIQPRLLHVDGQIAAMTNILRRALGEQITLQVVSGDNVPPVNGDPSMIDQTVLNLALNARDAMSAGGTLTISTEAVDLGAADVARTPEARPGRFVCLIISDTGCGMDAATQSRLFEPFFTTKTVGKGTGLGLATVYGIVKQHQGWIEVQSAVGAGTTFRVYLPASDDPGPGASSAAPGMPTAAA